jgi:hypothetical protein
MEVGGYGHASAPLPPVIIRSPLYWRLRGSQDRSGRVREISLPPGFDPLTVQPVASRYTYLAIPAYQILQFGLLTCYYGLAVRV